MTMPTARRVALWLVIALAPGVRAQGGPPIAPGATVVRVATGFTFVEGPAADTSGTLYFTDIPNDRIHAWSPTDGVRVVRDGSGGANGLRVDPDGILLVCEMANRRVTAIAPDGTERVLADRYQGRRFNSPNDLWLHPGGGIYFTDPSYGGGAEREIGGEHVYYIPPDRRDVVQVTGDLVRPNGIIGTPDGSRLYVADHGAGRTYVYAVRPDGSLGDRRLFASQGSDGMTLDTLGNLYLTGDDVTIYNRDGNPIGSIAVPEPPANLAFGGMDGTTLFITARTSLYAVEMTVAGQ